MLISASLFLASAGLINAADSQDAPDELIPVTSDGDTGTSRINVGPCWGVIDNPHNSSKKPGKKYVQAKTDMHCNDLLSNIGKLTVYQKLYYRASDRHSWSHMASNTTVCNDKTASNQSNGWVQCRKTSSNRHPVMISGVNALCLKGSRYDYMQTSSALLVTTDGRRYAGAAANINNDVYCKGK